MKALHVACPVRRAKPEERCRTIGGKEMPESHFKRKIAALSDELHHKGNGDQAPAST